MSKANQFFKAGLALAAAFLTSAAMAEVVTFETTSPVRQIYSGAHTYVEGSFEIAAVSSMGQGYDGAYAFTWALPSGTGLMANQFLSVSALNGDLFCFDGLDVLRSVTAQDFDTVTFVGVLADNTTVTRQFANRLDSPFLVGGTGGLFHYELGTEFSSLRSLMVSGEQHVIDNIAVTPVPEPQTYALMIAGLAMLGGVAARRKRSNLG
jgi:hypothetical protein